MTDRPSKITTTLNYNADGRQTGFLRLPHSVHRSAYGWLPIPIVVVKNGEGPTMLLMSGTHGDEYEGQVALTKLCRSLQPEDINGRVIILPMANFPAAQAGLRTSPIDEGNLNRAYPGDPDGNVTWMIAHYIESVLMDMADYAMDLHSGGSSLHYLPTLLFGVDQTKSPDNLAKLKGIAEAFGAPNAFGFPGGADNVSSAAARRQGVAMVGAEMGGTGTVTPAYQALTERAVTRVLAHVGIWQGAVPDKEAHDVRYLTAHDFSYFCYADDEGLFEPYVELGSMVEAGQAAGAIHFPDTPWREPAIQYFEAGGYLICKRIPGRVMRGDCLYHLGDDLNL